VHRVGQLDEVAAMGELRIGERRSAVRSDGRGTEMRVEDRWAALRREEPLDRDGYSPGSARSMA